MSAVRDDAQAGVERFFKIDVENLKQKLQGINEIITRGEADSCQLLKELITAIHVSLIACTKLEESLSQNSRMLAEVQKRFRSELAPWFEQSWFMNHATVKPRGYPGDYLMLSAIYEGEVKSEGFGGLLDRYFLQTDLARAVVTRLANIKQFMIDEIKQRDGQVRVLNVASGPGEEFSSGIQNLKNRITLTCLDTDEEALQFLIDNFDAESRENVDLECVCYNALKTSSAEKNVANFGTSDIVYSVGLCDYIPDQIMVRILEGWRKSVANGGIVYVAFKDSRTYIPAEYQWQVDWHFYQRTEEDCRNLFAQAGFDVDQMEMFRDETGVIMNFVNRIEVAEDVQTHREHELSGPHFTSEGEGIHQSEVKDSQKAD